MAKLNINKIKKVLIIICLLLIVVLLLFLLVVNKNNRDNKSNLEETENIANYDEYTSYDGLFSISAPSAWKPVSDKKLLNENAIIELQNEKMNAFLVVVVNNKIDLKEDFNTYKTKVFTQKEAYYKTKISAYKEVIIDNHQAQYGVIHYTNPNNINTYIRSYAFETDNYYGQIVIWTLASNEEEVQTEFDNITLSFKEIKD